MIEIVGCEFACHVGCKDAAVLENPCSPYSKDGFYDDDEDEDALDEYTEVVDVSFSTVECESCIHGICV